MSLIKKKSSMQLVEEAKQNHTSSASDDVGNYRFIVVGKGPRRKVIKIKKSNNTEQN